jgi:hypothetical protein
MIPPLLHLRSDYAFSGAASTRDSMLSSSEKGKRKTNFRDTHIDLLYGIPEIHFDHNIANAAG